MSHFYADAHIHLTLKQFMSQRGLWDRLKYYESYNGEMAGAMDYNQADPITLNEGNVKLVIANLHPPEKVLTKSAVNRLIAKETADFKPRILKDFYKDKTYFDRLNDEYNFLINAPRQNNGYSFHMVKSKSDLANENNLKVLLGIEGGHAFHGKADPLKEPQKFQQEVLDNVTKVKHWEYPVFALTLTHFAKNYLTDQSWAMPIPGVLKGLKSIRELFPDSDPRLRETGIEVIKTCLKKNGVHNKRILIDLKHTHLAARFEYYDFLKENNYHDVPVIISHAGASGIATKDAALSVFPSNDIQKEYDQFNPWEINLCDEEIKIIHNTGGLIGLIQDQRVLGWNNKSFRKQIKNSIRKTDLNHKSKRWHTALFVQNLFHVIKVIGDESAWDTVCIGSDFDGIIDPINSCPTADHFKEFEHDILEHVDIYYKEYKDYLPSFSFEKALRKLFYENLRDFTLRHF